jgi:hypothetical protein
VKTDIPGSIVRADLLNAVYSASVQFFEAKGEHAGLLRGNGHHMAQALAGEAGKIWDAHLKGVQDG